MSLVDKTLASFRSEFDNSELPQKYHRSQLVRLLVELHQRLNSSGITAKTSSSLDC